MHAIEHPNLPRIGGLALGAVLVAIAVLLLAATRVGDIGFRSGSVPKLLSARCQMRRKRNRLSRDLRSIFQWPGPRFPPLRMA
jgi:hypothetical protein